ncbi:MAG: IncA protein [Podoviridae sp. ctLUJ1]|nr:MAG: IncA protein [Podoviridae sp. ctLUJ1]
MRNLLTGLWELFLAILVVAVGVGLIIFIPLILPMLALLAGILIAIPLALVIIRDIRGTNKDKDS